MSLLNVTLDTRNGFAGLASQHSKLIQVKWQALRASCLTGETKPFVQSSGRWAHTAIITAHPGNTADLVFGPTQNADTQILSAGGSYLIPAIIPIVEGTWTAFDLGEWYFRCDTAAATIIVLYV